jgi:glycosyltransferase involved in cell wall biosynthesis
LKSKIIRTSTIALSLNFLLKGQLAFLQNHYEVVAVSGMDEHLETVGLREGVKTASVSMQRSIHPVKDIISLWQLYRLFRKEKPQIVHSITPKAGLLSMTAAYFAGVPIRIHTFTGLIFPTRKGMMQRVLIAMDKLLCRFATKIIPEGEGVKQDLIQYNITKKPLHVLANGNVNGIDITYFDPEQFLNNEKADLKNKLSIVPGDFVFIFVGRLVGDKGINELVEAFRMLSIDEMKVKLLLVGPLEKELDPLAPKTLEEIDRNRNIISVGFQRDIRPYFAIADALVFPSYREGFPNVVMQAGAMGLPGIVSNINGCNEIIIEGVNGTIIPVKDATAICQAMKRLKEDADYRTHLQKNARPLIVSRYQQRVIWEALLQEYKQLEQTSDAGRKEKKNNLL